MVPTSAAGRSTDDRSPENPARTQLLRASLTYVSSNGLTDLSLRAMACEIGTSHRMLIHHFGSKAGLEEAIAVAATQLLTSPLPAEADTAPLSPGETVTHLWQQLSRPSLEPFVRLYFDLVNRATSGDLHAQSAVAKVTQHWTETALALTTNPGSDETHDALVNATVTTAFLKGLLLDRLSGTSHADIEHAVTRFITLVDSHAA